MSIKTEESFNLEKTRLEDINKRIYRALTHFEDNPGICWTQIPMEKPLWEALQLSIEKQIPKEPDYKTDMDNYASYYICPTCGCMVIESNNYCSGHREVGEEGCGQKLDWDLRVGRQNKVNRCAKCETLECLNEDKEPCPYTSNEEPDVKEGFVFQH